MDDGQFGTYTGSRFGTTSNDSGYANKQDVLSYTRTGMSNSVNGGPGYSILGLRSPIDRYQNDGAVCPRESTLVVSRNFYVGGVGSSAQSEGMDFYNNKYPEYPLGTGISYGISLTKTGTDSVFREFSINFRCPTSTNPTTNATNVFRVLPFTNPVQDDPTKMSLARIRFENSNVDIAGFPVNYLSTTTLIQNILSISLTNHRITLTSSNADLYTGMPVIFNTPTNSYLERPGANVCNTYIGSSGLGIITGTGTISVVAGSPIVSGTSTLFATQQYFTVGAIITFGQYAYTVLSIQSDTSLTLTENVFANGTFNNQKWYFAYPSTHPVYYGRLARGGEYFVIVVDSSTIKFANTYDNAMKGTNIIFTTYGNGAQLSFSYNRSTSVKASSNLVANTNFVLPSNLPSANNVLVTDSSGNTSWTSGLTIAELSLGTLSGILRASSGVVSGSATTTDLTEGTNLYFTTTRVRGALSAGVGISYDSSTGLISNSVVTTTDLTEGTNLYFTSSRAKNVLSAGSGISYDSSTGVISNSVVTTTDLAEGTNLYFTSSRAKSVLSAGVGISYDTTSGVIANTVTTTTELAEGTNLYFTTARARTAISAGTGIGYDNTTGIISVSNVVTSITGTPNQVLASDTTGSITLSLPQSIDTTANPQFSSIGIGSASVDGYGINLRVPTTSATNYGLYMSNASDYTGSNDVGLWLNNTFTPSTTGASIISCKCTPTFNTSSGVAITTATGFDSSPSFKIPTNSTSTYTTVYGISTNPVLTLTATTALTVNNIRSLYLNPVANLSGAAHLVNSMVGLYVNSGSANLSNSSTLSVGYNIYLNAYSTGTFNYGLYVTGNYTKNNDQGLRLINTYTPTTNASGLYQARITPTFNANAGLTHSAYALDLTPNFNTSTTGTYTTVYGQNISPVINASGVTATTITAMRGLSITPSVNMSNAAHVLTNLNGIYVDVPSTTLGTGSITNSYGAYINVSSVANTNHGIFITGNFTKSSDLAFRLGSNITPTTSAATLYQTRLQGQFISSTGLTHSNAYGIDVNPTFASSGTGTFTTIHGQNISPVVNASGVSPILIVTLKGINVTPTFNFSNAAHRLADYYGVYVEAGTFNLGTGTISRAYGAYFKKPATGTSRSALYAEDVNIGISPIANPTLGDLRCVTAYAGNYRTTDSAFASVRNSNLFECAKYTPTWSIASAPSSVYMQRVGYIVTVTIASFVMNTSTSSECTASNVLPGCPATVRIGCPIIAYNGGYTTCIFSVDSTGTMYIQSSVTASNITPLLNSNIFPDATLCQTVQYSMQPL